MLDVRRLAAADMWGTRGSLRRRRLIRIEFIVGVLGCTVLGIVVLLSASGWWLAVGAWLVGIGLNYIPLAADAQALSRAGALESELAGRDLSHELRHAGRDQLWILVPLAVVACALLQKRGR